MRRRKKLYTTKKSVFKNPFNYEFKKSVHRKNQWEHWFYTLLNKISFVRVINSEENGAILHTSVLEIRFYYFVFLNQKQRNEKDNDAFWYIKEV